MAFVPINGWRVSTRRLGEVRNSEHLGGSRSRRYEARVAVARYRRPGALSWVLLSAFLLAGLLLSLAHARFAEAATPLPGFEDALVADVPSPTALAFAPDGRMLISTQPGRLRVYENGQLL